MKLVETFLSFQGEGIYAGFPAVFIRLATCNQNCKFCFVGSTQVNTLSGLKRIDQLQIGDKLLTLNPETSKMEQTLVQDVTSRLTTREEMLLVQIGQTKYWVTQDHPFWVVERGWVPAHRLQVNDVVLYGKKVTKIEHLKSHQVAKLQESSQSKKIRVYNLTTDKHTFLVNGVLVHNCDTRYSHSDKPETPVSQIEAELRKYNPVNHLVITGGEPLLQQTEVLDLVLGQKLNYSFITVETNGSIYPEADLINLVDFFSISPKLKGMAEYNWEPIVEQYLTDLPYKIQLKFVVVTNEDYEEMKQRLQDLQSYNKHKVPIVLQPNGMSDTLTAYAKSYGQLALKTANDPFWKQYQVRVLMQNHRVAWKQQSGI